MRSIEPHPETPGCETYSANKNYGKQILREKKLREKKLWENFNFEKINFGKIRPCLLQEMNAHAVSRVVLNEVEDSKGKPHAWTDEYTMKVTDWARHHGIRGAIDRHEKGDFKDMKLPWSTVDRWLQFWKTSGTYYSHQKRGRKRILTDAEVVEVQDAAKKLRDGPKEGFSSGTGVF